MAITDFPTITVEIAFATDPADSPTWEDVSAYVRSLSIRRGRNDELQKPEAGTCRLVLDNKDRHFDPTNVDGDYYPNVLPLRKLRVRATWDSVTYDLWTGYVERWPQTWRAATDALVSIEASDGFEALKAASFDLDAPQEASGSRIEAVLDEIGWSATDRDVDAGQSEVIAETLTGVVALQHLQDVADSERGYVFMSGDGKVTYHDRHRRILDFGTSQGTFGDDTGELPYVDVKVEFDKDRIRNDVSVAREGGSTFNSQDSASIDSYFRRSMNLTPKIATDVEAHDLADYLLSIYKDPLLEFRNLTLKGRMDADNLWPVILSYEIGTRITVNRTPPGTGDRISRECHVEGIDHDIAIKDNAWSWVTKWDLSAADPVGFWILADSTYGVLDTSTRLAY